MKNTLKLKNFSELEDYVRNHPSIKHPFFTYIKERSQEGFTAKQYQIYRDNFFFRTLHTIPSVASLVIAAALNGDMETLALAGQNLYEETGYGQPTKVHSNLLEFSHNTHAKKVFNLDAIKLKDIKNCKNITKEAKLFAKREKQLYQNNKYCIVLGAAFAHEVAATSMLIQLYESFFLTYKYHYTNKEFYKLSEYFLVHITGLEQEHADNAQTAAKRWFENKQSLYHLIEGSSIFLDSQSCLWDALYRELKNAEYQGKKIVPVSHS